MVGSGMSPGFHLELGSCCHQAPRDAQLGPARPATFAKPGRASAPPHALRMLRLLHILAIALLTVACAGFASQGRGAPLVSVIGAAVTTAGNASALRLAASPTLSQRSHNRATLRADLKALEAEGDGDGDAHFIPKDGELSIGGQTWPPTGSRAWRGECQLDSSRFAIRTGLARAPPTS